MPGEPAEYPREFDDRLILPDLRRLHVRALHRCEEEPIRELDSHLSVQSRYLRFLSPLPQTFRFPGPSSLSTSTTFRNLRDISIPITSFQTRRPIFT